MVSTDDGGVWSLGRNQGVDKEGVFLEDDGEEGEINRGRGTI